jgi:nicotinamidase-related amidase
MDNVRDDKPALLIIDMVKDTFGHRPELPIAAAGRALIAPINQMAAAFRAAGHPVVFSTDAFHPGDFIFRGRMGPHSLAGTAGAEVIDELHRFPGDLWQPKPRFSAFFDTGLEVWLRERGVTLCAVAGIATHFCVLTTALDALCHGFKAVFLEDCTTAHPETVHRNTLDNYRRNPLFPLLRVASSGQLLEELLDGRGVAPRRRGDGATPTKRPAAESGPETAKPPEPIGTPPSRA